MAEALSLNLEEKCLCHVMHDILVQLHGEGGASKFGSSYLTAQNKAAPEYLLPKRETLIRPSGLGGCLIEGHQKGV